MIPTGMPRESESVDLVLLLAYLGLGENIAKAKNGEPWQRNLMFSVN